MTDRKLAIRVSKDCGYTYGDWREGSIGEVGQYDFPIRFRRFGVGKDFRADIRITSPVVVDIHGLIVDAELGE